ncbi:MAG: hypothetical protein JJT96_00515 [Opitutales bacterium]|nr:hypothetical protein [Opitutales bacterium]
MPLPIAFFSDQHMLPGLHVALLSLLEALDDPDREAVSIYLFLDNVPSEETRRLRETASLARHKRFELSVSEFSPKAPEGAVGLHGNATVYGRLRLPELLPNAVRCLYLDSDLVIHRDVREVFDHFDGEHILLVDGAGTREYALERDLFAKAGLSLQGPVFNSGVMGIDLALWRSTDVAGKCADTARVYGQELLSADQALLNIVLSDAFKALGDAYNTQLFPWAPPVDHLERRIYHFVGSPKPWDPFGAWFSSHYRLWWPIYKRTAIGHRSPLRYATRGRTLSIARQIVRSAVRKFRRG